MTDQPATDQPAVPTTAAPEAPHPDPRLLEVLVCPVTHGPLRYDRDKRELISPGARLAYPVRDGIPIMLPEEARPLEEGLYPEG